MDSIWEPHVIKDINDLDLRLYLEFSSSPCIRGGGCSVEWALQVLFQSNGDMKLAMERLLTCEAKELGAWTESEIQMFEKLIMSHGKNFFLISRDLKSKNVKECVEFYYLWKHSSLRSPSVHYQQHHQYQQQQHHQQQDENNNNTTAKHKTLAKATNSVTPSSTTTNSDTPTSSNSSAETLFVCRVCGRAFEKIKSRSAHMKRHKNER